MTEKLTCVVTLHNEGLLAHRSLRSVIEAAVKCPAPYEVFVVLDNPDDGTLSYIQRSPFRRYIRVEQVALGDPAKARNYAISRASGSMIAIVDGDDLVSDNWFGKAREVVNNNKHAIVHPEWNVSFGADFLVWRHPDQLRPDFDPSRLLVENFWSALSFARVEVFQDVPYLATRAVSGFGFEDWHWNCTAIHRGYVHTVAPDTVHFIRLGRKGSRNNFARENRNVVPQSPLFDNSAFWAKSS